MWSSVTSVQRPCTHSMQCALPPPPLTAASALVKLWWVFPPWEAEHDMRSTMAGRWRASSIWWWPLPQRPLFLMWRNTRAAWFIMGAQVARDLMSHICAVQTALREECTCLKTSAYQGSRCHFCCRGISCFSSCREDRFHSTNLKGAPQ